MLTDNLLTMVDIENNDVNIIVQFKRKDEQMSETRTITPAEAKKSILACFNHKRPMFLWGPPGIGKGR